VYIIIYFRRKSGIPVTTHRESFLVVGPGTVRPQGVHGAHKSHPAIFGAGCDPFPDHSELLVRVLYADGPQHRFRHWPEHIVQWRGLRA